MLVRRITSWNTYAKLIQPLHRLTSPTSLSMDAQNKRFKAIADVHYHFGTFSEKIALSTGSVFAGWQVLSCLSILHIAVIGLTFHTG